MAFDIRSLGPGDALGLFLWDVKTQDFKVSYIFIGLVFSHGSIGGRDRYETFLECSHGSCAGFDPGSDRLGHPDLP